MVGILTSSMRARYAIGMCAVICAVALPRASTAAAQTPVAPATPSGFQRVAALRPLLASVAGRGGLDMTAKASATPPSGNISPNIEFLSNLPLATAISIGFIRNVAFVSTVEGVYSVDISDPTNPRLLGGIPMYIWENEHMTVDAARNLIVISRDPRGFTTPATTAFPYGAIHVIDVSNPTAMVEVGYHMQPTGHTATCINSCRYLWVTGPASPAVQVPGGADPAWGGRATWAVDISNPASPVDCPHFIDLNNNHGMTDYDHDTDVDANGVAWISGSGHVRGYWTDGMHYNPLHGRVELATGCDPIPYAGGNVQGGELATQGGVMHNSGRNLTVAVDGRAGDVLAATEEVTVTNCRKSGRFMTLDLGPSRNGAGWTNRNLTLPELDQWTPEGKPGSTGCDSAHWFTDRGDGLIAIAFYTQGTRLLDIRDPRHIKQVGYYNVREQTGTQPNDTWAAYWHGDNYIVVADFYRGLDILRYHPAAPGGQVQAAQAPGAPPVGNGNAAASTPLPDTPPGAPVAPLGLAIVVAGLTWATLSIIRRRRVRRC